MSHKSYQVSSLDEHGDVIDVDIYPTLSEARSAVPAIAGDVHGWVIEHRTVYERLGWGDKYVTIAAAGVQHGGAEVAS